MQNTKSGYSTETPVEPILPGFHSVPPYMSVKGVAQAIDFYKRAFGAQERYRLPGYDPNMVSHAEITIGNSTIMLADETLEYWNQPRLRHKEIPLDYAIYAKDVDTAFKRAVAAGASVIRPVADQLHGDRAGCIEDPFGHTWTIMTHQEHASPEE